MELQTIKFANFTSIPSDWTYSNGKLTGIVDDSESQVNLVVEYDFEWKIAYPKTIIITGSCQVQSTEVKEEGLNQILAIGTVVVAALVYTVNQFLQTESDSVWVLLNTLTMTNLIALLQINYPSDL